MPKRTYTHVNWATVRALAQQGVSLADLAKQFDVNYHAMLKRSYRERWGVAAIRANLPPASPEIRAQLRQAADEASKQLAIYGASARLNAAKTLAEYFEYYAKRKATKPPLSRKDAQNYAVLLKTSCLFFGWNGAKQGEGTNPVINLNVLAARPAELAAAQVREVVTDSQSSDLPSSSEAVRPVSATNQLS